MEKLLSFLGDYVFTVVFNWYGILLVITGAVGLYERIFERKIPIPVWLRTTILIFGLLLAQMFAYRDLQSKYDTVIAQNTTLEKENEGLKGKLAPQSDKTQMQQQEPLKIGHYSLGPTARRQKPGIAAYDFIVHTNRVITPVRLVVSCDGDIVDLYSRVLGAVPNSIALGGWERIRNTKNQYEIGLSAPAWTPMTPLLVTLYSDQKEVSCSFSQP